MTSINSLVKRALRIDLPKKQSAFLWGPRKTGKSTWLKDVFKTSISYDFLNTDVFFRLSKEPYRIREELLAADPGKLENPVILDEVQKVPQILDEVHWLIENKGLRFILCGSSARQLRRGHGNLLGGRAWRFEMLPLTWHETGSMNLLRALNNGLLPPHYFSTNAKRSLKAYVQDYLQEEIRAEGLVRNLPSFARFLDALGFSHGELTNFANIARDCGVDAKTVRSFYEILQDTMLGGFIAPFTKKSSRQLISSAEKFYLCDVGLAGYLCGRTVPEEKGEMFGRAFEHFILMELIAHRSYTGSDHDIRFWRTKTGYEVDFVLGEGEVAVEVKGSSRVDNTSLKPIEAFIEEYSPKRAMIVCNESVERRHDKIEILPWKNFLEKLWSGKVIG